MYVQTAIYFLGEKKKKTLLQTPPCTLPHSGEEAETDGSDYGRATGHLSGAAVDSSGWFRSLSTSPYVP